MRELIKSPMNYIGGKYKLLLQILDLFPSKINMFYDVFGGGANLSLNVNSEHVYYNDIARSVGNCEERSGAPWRRKEKKAGGYLMF